MTRSQLLTESSDFRERKGLQKTTGAFIEVSEEAVRRLNSSTSATSSPSASCSGFPNDQPSESTSTTTAATSTDSVTNSTVTVSKATKKQLQKQERDAALTYVLQQQLERQIAYYFSPSNLKTDTYLRTLQELNDGCVPVRALANFGKVKGILWATPTLTRQYLEEEARMDMIVRSIQQSETSILQVEEIDTVTGKILAESDDRHARNTIDGIRIKPGIELSTGSSGESNVSNSLSESVAKTVLLRDVHPDVSEEQVLHLMLNEVVDCPLVVSVHRDVANCWFIELDCESKEIMLAVVMQLRSLTLAGEYIHARLKSSTLHQAPPLDPVAVVIAEQVARRRRKKRGPRRNKKKFPELDNQDRIGEESKSAAPHKRSREVNDPPRLLEESEFPGLSEEAADTVSSNDRIRTSLEPNGVNGRCQPNEVLGRYAAALLKPKSSSTEAGAAKDVAPAGDDRKAKSADDRGSARVQPQRKSFAEAARAFSLKL